MNLIMDFKNLTTILLSGTSIAFGAYLGILRSKIFATKEKNTFYYSFIIASCLILLVSILSIGWNIFSNEPLNIFGFIIAALGITSSIILYKATKKHLIVKDIFLISELNPIINDFTSKADKTEIKLFGGDLNFFGNNPSEMDINSQYTLLRSLRFRKVMILCEKPIDNITKIRYGKILTEIHGATLMFYEPEYADLRVRGRIIKMNGVDRLLMYTKINPGQYEAIEIDTSSSKGALMNNIWKLVSSITTVPVHGDLELYKKLYQEN